MNGCKEIQFDFVVGTLDSHCVPSNTEGRHYTTNYYLNLSKLSFNVNSNSAPGVIVCKYDKNYKMVNRSLFGSEMDLGSNIITLDEDYYYQIAYIDYRASNLKGYQCNVGIASMSNELAFGSVNFLDTISTLIPFVIILIGFCLGFTLLKRLIKKSSKGSA